MSDVPTAQVEAVFEPRQHVSIIGSLREMWQYREVAWSFAMRRIRTRYKQTAFGLLWAIIQPLAFLGFFVAFLDRDNQPGYAAGTFGALVAWQFVNSAVSGGGTSLTTEAGLIRKVYFPRECVVLGSIGSFVPDLLLNLVMLLVLGSLFDVSYGLTWLWLPLLSVQVVLTALAICMPLAAMAVYYRDIVYMLPFLSQVWLFGSPIAYSVDRIADRWQWLYALLNPAVGPLVGFRNVVAYDRAPDFELLGVSAATTLVVLLLGYRWFKSLEREFVEAI